MSIAHVLGQSMSDSPLRMAFLRWQCRTRQIAMRENHGRPDDSMTPEVWLPDADEPMGHIITLLNKVPGHEVVPEMEHMARKTHDPAQRRENALRFLSATYYQKAGEFSDILTATFPPESPGAARLRAAETVRLVFDAYAQRFDLTCRVWRLTETNALHRATLAHNALFNPTLPPGTVVLGFEPDWAACSADPGIG